VILATFIPVAIALWWNQPSVPGRLGLACCLGVAAGYVPALIQIVTWPFISHSPDAVRATAITAVFGAASFSIWVTTRILKDNTEPQHPRSDQIKRGLRRLYLTILLPWTVWFGYQVYVNSHTINFYVSQFHEVVRYSSWLQDDQTQNEARLRLAHNELAVKYATYGGQTIDELYQNIGSLIEEKRNLLTNDVYVTLFGFVPLLLYPISLWVVAGFFSETKRKEDQRSA
jgi:hypothetical protein